MQLHYEQSKRHSPKRVASFILALFALLLAIAIMAVWMLIGYRQSAPPTTEPSSDITAQYEDPLTSVDCSLVILNFTDTPRFVLVQTNPAEAAVHVVHIPVHLTDDAGNPLSAILDKHGPLRVTQAVSAALELTIEHYIAWSAEGVQSFLNELDNGVTYTLPEDIHYTDEDGSSIRLSAGAQKLTGTQAAAVLQYSAWSNAAQIPNTATQMIAAVLNQYLVPQQSLNGYFAALSDTAQTDLRIDDYNAFRRVLTHLSDNNTGSLCRITALIGTEDNGRFVPDIHAMRRQTDLYS